MQKNISTVTQFLENVKQQMCDDYCYYRHMAEPNRWRLKHRVIYELHTGEKLSGNDAVIFLDGNRQNLDINNLFKLSRSALVRYNQDHIYNSDPNISLAAAQIATIKALKGQMINEK